MRSAYLIFNPTSGQVAPEQDLAIIRSVLEPEVQLNIHLTSKERSAADLAHQAIAVGADMVLVAGGDGTISATAEALLQTNIPLGVIPRGTANALAMALGIPQQTETACQVILSGKTCSIDAALCNGQPMILLAGIGLEAKAIEQADRKAKNRFGTLAYIWSGVRQVRNLKSFKAQIETESQTIDVRATAITIANAAPLTSLLAQGTEDVIVDDGLLDITVVTSTTTLSMAIAAYHLLRSGLNRTKATDRNIISLRAKQIRIVAKSMQKVSLDGNLVGTTPLEARCVPNSLRLIVPDD